MYLICIFLFPYHKRDIFEICILTQDEMQFINLFISFKLRNVGIKCFMIILNYLVISAK